MDTLKKILAEPDKNIPANNSISTIMECDLCHKKVKELKNGLCTSCEIYEIPTFLRNQPDKPALQIKANRPLLELIKGGKDK